MQLTIDQHQRYSALIAGIITAILIAGLAINMRNCQFTFETSLVVGGISGFYCGAWVSISCSVLKDAMYKKFNKERDGLIEEKNKVIESLKSQLSELDIQ